MDNDALMIGTAPDRQRVFVVGEERDTGAPAGGLQNS